MGTAIKDYESRSNVRQTLTATGTVGPFKKHEDYYMVVTERAGVTNSIQPQGRLFGQTSWQNIGSPIVGLSSGTSVDVRNYDEVQFVCGTYSSSGTSVGFIASGFFFKLSASDIAAPSIHEPVYTTINADIPISNAVATAIANLVGLANEQWFYEIWLRAHTDDAQVAQIIHLPTAYPALSKVYATSGGPAVTTQNTLAQPPTVGVPLGQSATANNSDYGPAILFLDVTFPPAGGTLAYAVKSGNTTGAVVLAGSFIKATRIK